MALVASALGYPLAGMVAPSFDSVLSPKAQALMMRAYMQNGYTPAAYKVQGGTYTFYAGGNVPSLAALPEDRQDKMIIGMQRARLDEWVNRPACFQEVHSQWIETREYVLLACPPKDGIQPAAVPYAPGPDIPGALLRRLGKAFPAILPLLEKTPYGAALTRQDAEPSPPEKEEPKAQ
jgi:hypothetical protein